MTFTRYIPARTLPHVAGKKTKPPGKSDLGDRFWKLRSSLGKTQEQLPPLDRLAVVNIENDTNKLTSGELQRRAAKAFGVNADDLMAYLRGEIELEELERRKELLDDGGWSLEEKTIMRLVSEHGMKIEIAEELVPRIAFQHRRDQGMDVDKLTKFVLAITGEKQIGVRPALRFALPAKGGELVPSSLAPKPDVDGGERGGAPSKLPVAHKKARASKRA